MDRFDNVGQKFKSAREYLGFSKEQVAQLLKISEQDITDIESEKKLADELQIEELCKIYCISKDELFEIEKIEDSSKFREYYASLPNDQKRRLLSIISYRKNKS